MVCRGGFVSGLGSGSRLGLGLGVRGWGSGVRVRGVVSCHAVCCLVLDSLLSCFVFLLLSMFFCLLVLSCVALSCLALPCLVLSLIVMPCLISSCLALSLILFCCVVVFPVPFFDVLSGSLTFCPISFCVVRHILSTLAFVFLFSTVLCCLRGLVFGVLASFLPSVLCLSWFLPLYVVCLLSVVRLLS